MGSMSEANDLRARYQAAQIRKVLGGAGWTVLNAEPCDLGCKIALIVETNGAERALTAADVEKAAQVAKDLAIKPKMIDGQPYYTVHHKPWSPK